MNLNLNLFNSYLLFFFYLLQLHLFSLQILHCKNTFSAKYFTVDARLLTDVSDQFVSSLIKHTLLAISYVVFRWRVALLRIYLS